MLNRSNCQQCGAPVVLVDDVTYNADKIGRRAKELPLVMVVHGCVAPAHELPDPEGEELTLGTEHEPAHGLIAELQERVAR